MPMLDGGDRPAKKPAFLLPFVVFSLFLFVPLVTQSPQSNHPPKTNSKRTEINGEKREIERAERDGDRTGGSRFLLFTYIDGQSLLLHTHASSQPPLCRFHCIYLLSVISADRESITHRRSLSFFSISSIKL
jgi:hypothetical protein